MLEPADFDSEVAHLHQLIVDFPLTVRREVLRPGHVLAGYPIVAASYVAPLENVLPAEGLDPTLDPRTAAFTAQVCDALDSWDARFDPIDHIYAPNVDNPPGPPTGCRMWLAMISVDQSMFDTVLAALVPGANSIVVSQPGGTDRLAACSARWGDESWGVVVPVVDVDAIRSVNDPFPGFDR